MMVLSRPNSGLKSGALGPLYRSDPLRRRNLSARLLSAFDRKLQSLDERFACLYTELSTPQPPPEGEAKAAVVSFFFRLKKNVTFFFTITIFYY